MVERITSNYWSHDKVLSSILSMCILNSMINYVVDFRNRFGQSKLSNLPTCNFFLASVVTRR